MAKREVLRQLFGSECYSRSELAGILGVSEATVARWMARGTLTSIRYGGRSYVTEEALQEFWRAAGGTVRWVQPSLPLDEAVS